MDIGISHFHHLVVVLYLLYFAGLFIIVLLRQKNLAVTVHGKLKIPRIVIETLMLGTGVYLLVRSPNGDATYNLVKYGLMVGVVISGIIALRVFKPIVFLVPIFLLIYVYGISLKRDVLLRSETEQIKSVLSSLPLNATPEQKGLAIYSISCNRCHGHDGQSAFRTAKNLAETPTGNDYKRTIIQNGLNKMPAFPYLTQDEINYTIAYINTFKHPNQK